MIFYSKKLSSFKSIVHGFSGRQDEGKLPENIVTLKQIHTDEVVMVDRIHPLPVSPSTYSGQASSPQGGGKIQKTNEKQKEGDALVTKEKNILIGIRTADCVPLLVYDPAQNIIAAIHAGWRGVIAGIIENTLLKLNELGSDSSNLVVAIGPSLCQKCFEVGPEVKEIFEKKFGSDLSFQKGRDDRIHINLASACQIILEKNGVSSGQIEILSYCTKCHQDQFYSYRGGDKEGRNYSYIGLE